MPDSGGWWLRPSPRRRPTGSARSCARWWATWSTPSLRRDGARWWSTCASPTRSRSSASCSGAPKEDWRQFSAWATDIFRIFNQNLAEDLPLIEAASAALEEYLADLIAERRVPPGDDLLSVLIAIEEEGDRLSTDELVSLAVAVLMAGTDTTRNQLACALALFAEHPEQWALLAERPDLAPRAVEEAMRYLGAVRGTVRFAPEDIVFRDVLFPKGTLISVSLAGANRDPGTWEAPDVFDITRERETQQMTFGSGIHHCMGAALARAELQEALVLLSAADARTGHRRPGRVEADDFRHLGPGQAPAPLRAIPRLTGPDRPRRTGDRRLRARVGQSGDDLLAQAR